ncbi:sugar kinase [Nocardiopsis kunsanensis]|uniref:sugar kinase n=1 Tax=Nocardiopsis kunsanensis TaxID=141693 RepID=UPI00034A702A|nr:sugar kinase [Nocardiopsis kunsanensis]
MTRFLSIGECMIELTHKSDHELRLGFGGDTYNTALYLARSTAPDQVGVDYLTLAGDDHYSDLMAAGMRQEGIGTGLVGRVAGAHPGLYLVRTDEEGERSFAYYRSQSPARRLFDDEYTPTGDLSGHDVLYLSGVTLQLLTARARQHLWTLLEEARGTGTQIAFDSNYRPVGWPGPEEARAAVSAVYELSTTALSTFEDEQALFGDASPEETVRRLRGEGVEEVVIKDGSRGCVVGVDGEPVHVPAGSVEKVVDSTAAGDSFNAGYLAGRFGGASVVEAARNGHALAAKVIAHPGAVIEDSSPPPRGAHA